MFRVTHLGNHGWSIATAHDHILVDPLLCTRYGWTDSLELRVWPPCRFDFEKLPAVDAIVLTHEHEGHFDLASLAKVDRSVPIYVSAFSSLALREVLREMGFVVHLVVPGEPVRFGSLELHPMVGDQENANAEEWDDFAYLVRDLDGHGSFFTNVDLRPTEAMWRAARAIVDVPGLWAHSNNYSQWHFQNAWASPDPQSLAQFVEAVSEYHGAILEDWSPPEAVVLVGGGFSFGGDKAWVNEEVFPCSSDEAAKVLGRLFPEQRFASAVPGNSFVMEHGKLVSVTEHAPFVGALPREEWPQRGHAGKVAWIEGYAPATGKKELPPSDLPVLEKELERFAQFIYGREPFRRLYSLDESMLEGRRPTFAFVLLSGDAGEAYVYEYVPQACRFRRVACEDPVSTYLAAFECWGTDLLALLRAEISSASLTLGRSRQFMADVELFEIDFYLMLYTHPLHQPERFLSLYRQIVERVGRKTPDVVGRSAH